MTRVRSLNMAAAFNQNDVFVQNSVEIEFMDEDDLPLANVMEHRESDEDLADEFELVAEEEEANGTIPLHRGEPNDSEWSRNKNLHPDLAFHRPTGPGIEFEEDMKAVDFFSYILPMWCGIISLTRPIYMPHRREGLRNDPSGMH